MKLSKFKRAALLSAFYMMIFILSSCKSDTVSPIIGEVQGQIINTGNSTGASGVKVYLLNASFRADTINTSNNKKALLDSTTTDANGRYSFTYLPEGKYGVVPVLSNSGPRINYDNSSPDSYVFEINGVKHSFTVNFSYTYPPMDENYFQIIIQFKNFKALTDNYWYISSGRRYEYFLDLPILSMTNRNSWVSDYDPSIQSMTYTFPYGSVSSTSTLSNKINFFFSEVTLDASYKNVYRNSYNFEFDFTMTSCPATSTFEYDWEAHTFTRIK